MTVYKLWSSKIIKENNSFSVDTPISYEQGFNNFNDAYNYLLTFGKIDKR